METWQLLSTPQFFLSVSGNLKKSLSGAGIYVDLRGWSRPRLGRSCSSELF